MNTIHNLQTARNWHDNHYEHTTPDSHQGRWRQFIEIDPFNPENRLEGHIQMQGGDEYGTLAIHTVNGMLAPQFIRTMPKTTYPFFKDGSWVLTGMESLEAYCKLDGTNICQFGYHDAYGLEFTTFKVRIRPFMAPHFINLMEQCFRMYPGIRDRKLHPARPACTSCTGTKTPCSSITTTHRPSPPIRPPTGRPDSHPPRSREPHLPRHRLPPGRAPAHNRHQRHPSRLPPPTGRVDRRTHPPHR